MCGVSKQLGFSRNFYSVVENSRSLLATGKLTLLNRSPRGHQLGQSVRDVSSQLKFSSNYFSSVENGRALLATDKLTKLCQVLEFNARED